MRCALCVVRFRTTQYAVRTTHDELNMPRFFKILGYATIFVITFLLFTYWMLPVEAAKERVISTLEKQLGSSFQVEIEELDTYRLTGASLDNVVIRRLSEGKPQTVFQSERLRFRFGLFSLLLRNPKITFDAKMEEARVRGNVQKQEEGYQITAGIRNLNVGKIPYVRLASGLQLSSAVEGKLNLFYNAKSPLKTEGDMKIDIEKLSLKKSTIPLGEMGSFPLPDLDLGGADSGFQTKIEKGAMQIESLKLNGKDLNVDLKGRVFLSSKVSQYRLSLQGSFQFSPKVWGVLDPILPEAWLAELKKQQGKGERFPLSVSGQLSSPQVYCGSVKLYPLQAF